MSISKINTNSIAAGASPTMTDLTLSGGVYLGGTGAANYLDDYEEGTFTPVLSCTGGNTGILYSNQVGRYTKVGDLVTATLFLKVSSLGSASGSVRISGWPFTPVNISFFFQPATMMINNANSADIFDGNFFESAYFDPNDATLRFFSKDGDGTRAQLQVSELSASSDWIVSVTYKT